MSSTDDRRILRTKSAIRAALISLIEEKGFEALSVKDLMTKANLNRGTFYLHYQDKFDLLDQTLEEITRDVESILMEFITLLPEGLKDNPLPSSIIIKMFNYFDANAALMQVVFETKGYFALQSKIKKVMWKNLFEKQSAKFIKTENLLVPSEYLTAYISAAHFGMIQEWLERGRRETPEQMARILMNLSFHGPLFSAGVLAPAIAPKPDTI